MSPSQSPLLHPTAHTPLLHAHIDHQTDHDHHADHHGFHTDAHSYLSKSESTILAGQTAVGERLPYNSYTTIDWLHDLVQDSARWRALHLPLSHDGPGLRIRDRLAGAWDDAQGWVAVAIIGVLTAVVAFLVDGGVVLVGDWKDGRCGTGWWRHKELCCAVAVGPGECDEWKEWSHEYWGKFGVYVAFAVCFGVISSSITMLTRATLPMVGHDQQGKGGHESTEQPKMMYMAAGSGIPEIKTILSGFVIPNFLDFKVLVVKAVGATFAVATGMCLGKEGPFVHISTCVAYLVGMRFSKYRDNGRKMRELLSAGCSAGLSVAFGAPIGGVLFSYEEISTYFPRKVLWRAFLCSLFAAVVLKALNPTGTGKLVLFETNYGITYDPIHYLVFMLLGVAGGLFGGVFCKANFLWSKHFRKYPIIKNYPVLEVAVVVLATALLQFPNPMTRDAGDVIIKNLLVDCRSMSDAWVCQMEQTEPSSTYIGWLVYGTLAKLFLTTITFGCKVPSGIIIPALDAGAFFGRLVGQVIPGISPGIFAMVGAAAFLAGVSRMTLSLVVIMFELTGELEYIVPHMIAILIAKWVADALEREGVYDLAQTVLGHPFLDLDHALQLAQRAQATVEELIPPRQTMQEITVNVSGSGVVMKHVLSEKLRLLRRRGLMDAGLVLVQDGMLQGYLAEGELEFGVEALGKDWPMSAPVRLLGNASTETDELDLTLFVDRAPLTLCAQAPMEYAVEMFGKLGLRYLCLLEEGSGKLVGVVIKKRLVVWLEHLKH